LTARNAGPSAKIAVGYANELPIVTWTRVIWQARTSFCAAPFRDAANPNCNFTPRSPCFGCCL